MHNVIRRTRHGRLTAVRTTSLTALAVAAHLERNADSDSVMTDKDEEQS